MHSAESKDYLHFQPTDTLPSYTELVASQQILSASYLKCILQQAYSFLTETPGLYLSFRQLHAVSWLGWWIEYLEAQEAHSSSLTIHSSKVMPTIQNIAEHLQQIGNQNQTSGLLLMGGGEGTDGHRFAVDWVAKHVDIPIFMFEEPQYVGQKVRGGRFLPLEVGLSMWAHYPGNHLIGLVPPFNNPVSLSDFYQGVHDQTGALYHFASAGDPYLEQKIHRGLYASFCTIPFFDTPSTTSRTQKLLPDTECW